MPPVWLTALAWAALAAAFASAARIGYGRYGCGYRQHMKIMEAVWPITALYYYRSCRTSQSHPVTTMALAGVAWAQRRDHA
jgi:hypothetical protein